MSKALEFDPLDMRNYSLEKLPEMKGGKILEFLKLIGLPLGILSFFFFYLRWCGTIEGFEQQTKVAPQLCYTALAVFVSSLILWLTEAIPNYLTSFLIIVVAIVTGLMKMRPAFAYLGEPVMILNIASFILASALVVTGLARRISLYIVLRLFHRIDLIFWAFIILNLILGAFISATSAKTALLLPLFMVISAIFGATGGEYRNAIGKNLVLQNLLANNVSASGFMTGSAANLLAVTLLQQAGAHIYYGDWFMALFPLSVIQCAIAWWFGTRIIFKVTEEDARPKLEGGEQRLRDEYNKLGPITIKEIQSGLIFLVVLIMWATDRFHGIRAEVVALSGATIALFPAVMRLPAIGVLKWNQADIPWHMLMFSWGAYVLGGLMDSTDIMGIGMDKLFHAWNITIETPKWLVFAVLSALFGITTLVSESKTARTIIMFPILISTARTFGWDLIGFCLPMAFMINQVYVLYFNSKPATISYLTNQYSTWESFKYGMSQMIIIWLLLIPWTQYFLPLLGFDSKLW